MNDLGTFLWLIPFLIVSLVLHELAHALVATKLGDPTPRREGRLTLNPIAHLDPLGTIMFAVTYFTTGLMFGWARPVMVDARRFRQPSSRRCRFGSRRPIISGRLEFRSSAADSSTAAIGPARRRSH